MVHCCDAGFSLWVHSLTWCSKYHATPFNVCSESNHATIERHVCRPDEVVAASVSSNSIKVPNNAA